MNIIFSKRWLLVVLLYVSTCLLLANAKGGGGRGGGGRGGGGRGGFRGGGFRFSRPSYSRPAPAPAYRPPPAHVYIPPPAAVYRPPVYRPPVYRPPVYRPPPAPVVVKSPASSSNFKRTDLTQGSANKQPAYNPNYKPDAGAPAGPPPPYSPSGYPVPIAPAGPPPPYRPNAPFGNPPAVGKCQQPIKIENGEVKCNASSKEVQCDARCDTGYRFPHKVEMITNKCWHVTGIWRPQKNFPKCQAYLECDIRKLIKEEKVDWACAHTRRETKCKISCKEPGQFESTPSDEYKCSAAKGVWTPDTIPHCVISKKRALESIFLDK